MINEGARILDEGVALRGSDIDVIFVYGYGWPAHKGGPMYHADVIGAATVLEQLRALQAEHGAAFEPSPLVERLAAEGGRFSEVVTA
jgi:3-hydroxyacyl-CoA dehydrogenase